MLSWFWASSCYFLFSCPAWLVPPVFCHQYKSSTGEYYCSITYGPTLNVGKCVRKAERRLKIPSLINVNVRFRSSLRLTERCWQENSYYIFYSNYISQNQLTTKYWTKTLSVQQSRIWTAETCRHEAPQTLLHSTIITDCWSTCSEVFMTCIWRLSDQYFCHFELLIRILNHSQYYNFYQRSQCPFVKSEMWHKTAWNIMTDLYKLFTRSIDELLMNLKCQIIFKKAPKKVPKARDEVAKLSKTPKSINLRSNNINKSCKLSQRSKFFFSWNQVDYW